MPKYVLADGGVPQAEIDLGKPDDVMTFKGKDYVTGEPIPMTEEDYVAWRRSGWDLYPYEAPDSSPAPKAPEVELGAGVTADAHDAPLVDEGDESDSLRLGPRQRESLAAYGYTSDSSILGASDEDLRAAGLSEAAISRVRGNAS